MEPIRAGTFFKILRRAVSKDQQLAKEGLSYRALAKELGLSKDTVMGVIQRGRGEVCQKRPFGES